MHLALKVAKDSLIRQMYAGGSRFPQSPLTSDLSKTEGTSWGEKKKLVDVAS